MTDEHPSRRRVLAAVGVTGAFAGCTGLLDEEPSPTPPDEDATPSPTESPTAEPTETTEPEAAVEITDVTLRGETVTVGDPVEVEVSISNTGGADGTLDVSLELDGEEVRTERVEVPAGENVREVLSIPTPDRTGTVTVSIDERTVGDVTIEAPDVLHVAPDGAADAPGTEARPLDSIADAVGRAGPGDTVQVHPGEYFEYVEFREAGEPDAPITLTGPPDAVLKPLREPDHQAISVAASYIHITGLTITGLYDPDNPEDPASYNSGKLIDLNTFPNDPHDYIEGLVISPHRIGNAGSSLIRNCEFGPFEVIGPAGVAYLHGDERTHQGEIIYLGTPRTAYELDSYPWDTYDHTRDVRVHHVDNSAGYNHSELVDCKMGTENVTIEYCTDGGGSRIGEDWLTQSIAMHGHRCTVRWNRLENGEDDGIEMQKPNPHDWPAEEYGYDEEIRERNATDNEIYGNVVRGFGRKAIALDDETAGSQRYLCGNDVEGDTDGRPAQQCSGDLPDGDGIGHTGGTTNGGR